MAERKKNESTREKFERVAAQTQAVVTGVLEQAGNGIEMQAGHPGDGIDLSSRIQKKQAEARKKIAERRQQKAGNGKSGGMKEKFERVAMETRAVVTGVLEQAGNGIEMQAGHPGDGIDLSTRIEKKRAELKQKIEQRRQKKDGKAPVQALLDQKRQR